jgi:HlyD family secretion protein
MQVSADTVLIKLSNPELEQAATDAQYQLQAGEADFNSLKVRGESERLSQQAVAASVRADYQQAKLQSETDQALAAKGLIPALSVKFSSVRAVELATRDGIEQERLKGSVKSAASQQSAARARLEQLRAQAQLKRNQVGTLQVVAGTAGVLQQVQVEVGQQITPGTNLARVVEPQNLKAELRIPEAQAKDIQLDQIASIDTRNGIIEGRVARIDPSVQQGTVTVDVMLRGHLPQGARPDLSVDGTIELERLTDVTYIERPAFGQSESVVELFKLEADGKTAVRVNVTLGRSSVNTVEVLNGLEVGDRIILSDMSAWNSLGHIVLK